MSHRRAGWPRREARPPSVGWYEARHLAGREDLRGRARRCGKDAAGPAFICRVSAHPQARPAVRKWAPRRSRLPRARQGQAGGDRSRPCLAAAQLAGRGCVGRLCALWRLSSARTNAVGAAVESGEVRGSSTCELRRAGTWGMRAPECSLSLRGAGRPGSRCSSALELLNRPGMSEAAESCTVECESRWAARWMLPVDFAPQAGGPSLILRLSWAGEGAETSPPRRFFTAALNVQGDRGEVVTVSGLGEGGRGPGSCCVAQHRQYENNRVECDHGRLKARLWRMRGLRTERTRSVVIREHACVQNLRRGHGELASRRDAGGPVGELRPAI